MGPAAGAVAVAALLIAGSALSGRTDAGGPVPRPSDRVDSRAATTSPSTIDVTASEGTSAPSQLTPQRPKRVVLASGRTVHISPVSTLSSGALDAPADITIAGWWDGGARLGDPFGAIVVAAHVDSTVQGLGPFSELLGAAPGDLVTVRSATLEQLFAVSSVVLVAKDRPSDIGSLFSAEGDNRLVLITCAGPYDPENGGYQNIVAVTATPSGRPVARPAPE